MPSDYRLFRNIAIILGLFTFFWFIYELITNYKSVNSDYLRANNYFLEKKYDEALSYYSSASKLEPTNLYALEGKARALMRLGKIKEAEELFKLILDKDKNFLPALTNLGIFYDTIGDYKNAIYYYKKALEHDKGISKGMSWIKRFLKNIQFKPSSIKDRLYYLENQLKLDKEKQNLKNKELDSKQPDFEM